MENIPTQVIANVYTGNNALAQALSTCTVDGKPVDCEAFLNFLSTGGAVVLWVLLLILALILIVSGWKINTKANQPGWAVLVPVYNLIVFLRVIRMSGWWVFLFIIPTVNIVFAIYTTFRLGKVFGKSPAFIIGLIFLPFIFYPMLAFGSSKYQGEHHPEPILN